MSHVLLYDFLPALWFFLLSRPGHPEPHSRVAELSCISFFFFFFMVVAYNWNLFYLFIFVVLVGA
jgi:hypothetical protein